MSGHIDQTKSLVIFERDIFGQLQSFGPKFKPQRRWTKTPQQFR